MGDIMFFALLALVGSFCVVSAVVLGRDWAAWGRIDREFEEWQALGGNPPDYDEMCARYPGHDTYILLHQSAPWNIDAPAQGRSSS